VKHVQNITDVGHLTSDEDAGEDKMEAGAKREGKSAWDVAKFYTKAFKSDFKKLNILPPDIWCKATDHIKEQIELIKVLEKKGFTYQIDDGIYFDTSKLKDYGKLVKLDIKGLKAGARIDIHGKKLKTDFALWKFSPKNKKRDMEWKSPWGVGFPGWHIECSAMAMKYLGNPFDLHCGGIDHAPVHHTNEIAQTEGATNKELAKVWLHGEFLIINKGKMSKSKDNFITLASLEERGFSAEDYRYFLLNAHYRMQLHFSWEALESAKCSLIRLKENVRTLKRSTSSKNTKNKYAKLFLDAINDDLNIPKALAITWTVIRDKDLANKEKILLMKNFDKVLGLDLFKREIKVAVPKEVLALVKQREAARKTGDFQKSDELRNKIKKKGFTVEDTSAGFKIKQ